MAGERPLSFKLEPDKPKVRLPLGSWDTHCHVLGPTDRFPYASTAPVDFVDAPKEKLFVLHAMLGVERCVIVHTAAHGSDLRVTEDAPAAKGGTYLGVALLQIHMEGTVIPDMESTLARSPVPVVIDHIAGVDAGLGLGQPQFKSLRV